MCDCIQLGDYVCCPRGEPQDKCIEIGNYICCPRENPTCKPCSNHNSFCYGSARAKSCHCTRSRSEEPQQQQRYVEEKFSNMIPPSFLCKNTDPPKPKKVRKPKVSKKEKEKVDEEAARDESNNVPSAPMRPGIYMPEGMTLAPEIPQVNADGGDVGAEAGAREQPQGTIPNPNGLGYTPGYLPGQAGNPPGQASYPPGQASYPPGQAIPGYGANVPTGYMPPGSSTIPGTTTAPGQAYPGYVPNVPQGYMQPGSSTLPGVAASTFPGYAPGSEGLPIYQPGTIPLPGQTTVNPNLGYPGYPPAPYAPYGSPFGYTPQMPAGDPNSLGSVEEGSTSRQKHQAAGLPSHRQTPFNPCTGEECNRDGYSMRRSKSSAPTPRARNGLGVGFAPEREYQPHQVEESTKSASESNRDETPSFNCCCHCSLSSDLIERICKSLQISSCPCVQNCCSAGCPKMNATKKPTVSTIPAPRRKPIPSRSGTSQLGKKDDQTLDRDNNKLAAGPSKSAASARRIGSHTGSSGGSPPRGEERLPATTSEESPATAASSTHAAPGKGAGSKFSACGCGCKDFSTHVPPPPATRTCSCYANLMARSDDSTQTPPPETNDAVVLPPIGSQGGDLCCKMGGNGATCCSGGACGGTGAGCCKAGHSACCGNSCCWPYYYYYDPCTGLYYCYRNCCYNNCYKNTKCCNSCCNNSCCKSNNNNNNNDKKSPTQEPKKTTKETKSNLSATNSSKRKETKTTAARKSNQRNMGGDAMVPYRPEMQDLYEQWINFQEYLKQYQPQAAPMANPMPGPRTAPTPASTPNPYGYYAAAISTPFYFAPSSYPNQMNNPAAGNGY
ncbi:uncharacterized protein LOC6638964 isoform X2 [Drosophila willistoni]|uniref:uncharacterized protein LOC6638964 isoform X2 n=1 Tax=Drosophila willistoni TaxID=7260 RepID=UPI001F08391B|nr:uncharacterized protein LOC6638964 isoform X2 [Drosophila willistoni]